MKKLAAIVVFCAFVASVAGQNGEIDGLKKSSLLAPNDTAKARVYLQLSTEWSKSNPDSAIHFAHLANTLFAKNENLKGIADAQATIGKIKTGVFEIPAAIKAYNSALELYEKQEEYGLIADVKSNLGVIYGMQENYSKALSYFFQALKYYEQHGNESGIAISNMRIGVVHFRTHQLDQALDYYKKALQVTVRLKDDRNAAGLYNNLGAIYGQRKQYAEALRALHQSRMLAEKTEFLPVSAEAYLNLGNSYRELGKLDSSAFHFARAEQYMKQLKNEEGLARTYDGWAELLFKEGKTAAAKIFAHRSIDIARKINNNSILYDNHQLLLRISKTENDIPALLHQYEQIIALKDTIFDAEKTASLEKLKADYQQQRDEMLIAQLKKENTHKTRQRNILLGVTLFGALLLIALIISLVYIYNKNVQIRKRRLELAKLNTMKDKFLSILSHDMRSPLNNIMLLLNLVASNEKDKENKMIYDRLRLTTGSVLETMDNMLAWGKNHFTKNVMNKQRIDLAVITERVTRFLKQSADNKRVHIANLVNAPIIINADEQQVEFVLRNLVSNAIKFSYAGSVVEINAQTNHDRLFIHVKDYGTGMSEAMVKKLFDLQDRESTKGTSGETGSGLGLVLCQQFIVQHNGSIQVNSEPGKGSEFIITLPYVHHTGQVKIMQPKAEAELV